MKNSGFDHFFRNHVGSISSKKRINFFRQMGILTRAGIPLLQSLKMLHKSAKGGMKNLLRDSMELIEQGESFSSIGNYYTIFFDKTTLSMMSAGEESGNLSDILKEIYINLEKKERFKRKIRGALMMPMFTLIFAIGVIFFMALSVIPAFTKFLESMGSKLPPITQSVLDMSAFIITYWKDMLTYAGITIVTVVIIYKLFKPVRYGLDYVLMYSPLIGPIALFSSLSNFSNSMEKLIGSGVGLVESLEISNEGVGLLPFKTVINKVSDSIISGGRVYEPFEEKRFIPVIYADLLYAGEESGNLDDSFGQLAMIYEEEADLKISTLQAAISPIMTIFIGGIVGYVATSLILGMVSLWGDIG